MRGGDPVSVLGPLLWLSAFVLVGLLVQRWGADSRQGVDRPPERWVGQGP